MRTKLCTCGLMVMLFVQPAFAQQPGGGDRPQFPDAKTQPPQTKQQKQQQARQRAKQRDVALLLKQFDKNKDGVLDEAETPAALWRRLALLDTDKDQKLSKTELQKLPGRSGRRAGEFITRPARGERHKDTLKAGDAAPDFTLSDPTGKRQVTLSSFRGKRPVVLIFGSYT